MFRLNILFILVICSTVSIASQFSKLPSLLSADYLWLDSSRDVESIIKNKTPFASWDNLGKLASMQKPLPSSILLLRLCISKPKIANELSIDVRVRSYFSVYNSLYEPLYSFTCQKRLIKCTSGSMRHIIDLPLDSIQFGSKDYTYIFFLIESPSNSVGIDDQIILGTKDSNLARIFQNDLLRLIGLLITGVIGLLFSGIFYIKNARRQLIIVILISLIVMIRGLGFLHPQILNLVSDGFSLYWNDIRYYSGYAAYLILLLCLYMNNNSPKSRSTYWLNKKIKLYTVIAIVAIFYLPFWQFSLVLDVLLLFEAFCAFKNDQKKDGLISISSISKSFPVMIIILSSLSIVNYLDFIIYSKKIPFVTVYKFNLFEYIGILFSYIIQGILELKYSVKEEKSFQLIKPQLQKNKKNDDQVERFAHDMIAPLSMLEIILAQMSISRDDVDDLLPTLKLKVRAARCQARSIYDTDKVIETEHSISTDNYANISESIMLALQQSAVAVGVKNQIIEFIDISNHSYVHINQGDFLRILSNIFINALKALRHNDKMIVSVTNKEDSQFSINITNTGSYISFSDRRKIFRKHYSRKFIDGKGIGLHLVKVLVKKNRGTIDCQSFFFRKRVTFRVIFNGNQGAPVDTGDFFYYTNTNQILANLPDLI